MKENKILDLIDDEELELIVGGCSNSTSSWGSSHDVSVTPNTYGAGSYGSNPHYTPSSPGILSGPCGGF